MKIKRLIIILSLSISKLTHSHANTHAVKVQCDLKGPIYIGKISGEKLDFTTWQKTKKEYTDKKYVIEYKPVDYNVELKFNGMSYSFEPKSYGFYCHYIFDLMDNYSDAYCSYVNTFLRRSDGNTSYPANLEIIYDTNTLIQNPSNLSKPSLPIRLVLTGPYIGGGDPGHPSRPSNYCSIDFVK